MAIQWDLSISIISIIVFGICSVSFLFNVGVLMQIKASAFLEKFDDKEKIIKDAQKKLFDLKADALRKLICLFPYFISIVFCYSVSPFITGFCKKQFPNCLPKEYTIDLFIFLLLYVIFLIGEAFWGINEKHIIRKGSRIYYNRPWILMMMIIILFIGTNILESAISKEIIQSIMSFFHIHNIEEFHLTYVFAIVALLNNLFIIKFISRLIVLIDCDTYIKYLKEENRYYSFYGIANLILSLFTILISVFFIVKYSIWKELNFLVGAVAFLMVLGISVLAGQRDYFVSMTRRKCIKNNKVYYRDVNDKKRLVDDKN